MREEIEYRIGFVLSAAAMQYLDWVIVRPVALSSKVDRVM